MTILLLLIPVSLLFVVVGAIAFFWAVNHRQFEELDAAALLPMADGDLPPSDRTEPVVGTQAASPAGDPPSLTGTRPSPGSDEGPRS